MRLAPFAAAAVLFGVVACDATTPDATAPGSSTPQPRLSGAPDRAHSLGRPFAVRRDGIDALVWVDRGRHDTTADGPVGDSFAFNVTVEVFAGTWRFGPEFIACVEGDRSTPARVHVGPPGLAPVAAGERRYWKVGCGHAAAAPPLRIAVAYSPGTPLATWDA